MLNRDFDVRVAHEQADPDEGEMLRVCVSSAAPCNERCPRGCNATSAACVVLSPQKTRHLCGDERCPGPLWLTASLSGTCASRDGTPHKWGVRRRSCKTRYPTFPPQGRPCRHIHQDCRWPCTAASFAIPFVCILGDERHCTGTPFGRLQMQVFRFTALQLGSPTACLVFSHPREKVLLDHTLARLGVLYNPRQTPKTFD